jgi:hypothetical protein
LKSRITSLEELGDNQKRQVEQQLELAKVEGVTIGAFVGRTSSDLRPLVLQDGNLWLVRIGQLDPARRNFFSSLYGGMVSKKDFIRSGEAANGSFYVIRKYFEHTLSEELAQAGAEISQSAIQSLLESLSLLHQRGLFHGHLSPGNIVRLDDEIHLLDYGWLAAHADYGQYPEDAAPEVIAGQPASEKSDIFGLGCLLKFYAQNADISGLIQSMLSDNPDSRPRINEVFKHLFPSSGQGRPHIISVGKAARQSSVRSGRLIRAQNEQESKAAVNPGPAMLVTAKSSEVAIVEKIAGQNVSNDTRSALQGSAIGAKNSRVIGYILAVLLLMAILYKFASFSPDASNSSNDLAYYEAYWSSGQPSLMREVAVAAAESDKNAELAILRDALSGTKREGVRMHLIRSAFNPDWESELSRRDRELIFKLSLASLLPEGMRRTPQISRAHPAVVMSVAGISVLEGEWSDLAGVPLSSMFKLKSPYGPAFEALARSGVSSMEDLRARALSRLLLGDVAKKTIEVFLAGNEDPQAQTERMRILVYLATHRPEIVASLVEYLRSMPGVLGERLRWFSAEGIVVDWESVKDLDKLLMVAEMLPDGSFDFEYYLDLLKFPSSDLRHHAEEKLLSYVSAELEQIVRLLGSEFNLLSRYQSVSLMFGLNLQGKKVHPFLSAWFETAPHAQTVLNVLALKSNSEAFKIFGLEAARYLKDQDWEASLGQLRSMAESQEPLVRALAYSRLNPSTRDHLAILKKSLERENVARLREEIENRIQRESSQGP